MFYLSPSSFPFISSNSTEAEQHWMRERELWWDVSKYILVQTHPFQGTTQLNKIPDTCEFKVYTLYTSIKHSAYWVTVIRVNREACKRMWTIGQSSVLHTVLAAFWHKLNQTQYEKYKSNNDVRSVNDWVVMTVI